jgi:hypothetical protein
MLPSDAQIRDFVRSERGYVLFQRSARWMVVFGIFFVLLIPASILASMLRIDSLAFDGLIFCFMVAGSAAGLTIFFGMSAYLILCDQSSARMRWAAVFFFTTLIGCTIYFFKVYRKQMLASRAISAA